MVRGLRKFGEPEGKYQNTNIGVERLNKELKYGYPEGLKCCSLSELVAVKIKNFLKVVCCPSKREWH